MNQAEVLEWKSYKWKKRGYKRIKYEDFNYDSLKDLAYRYKQRDGKYTDAVIMAEDVVELDDETVQIFDSVPVKKEVKAVISGIYITDVKGLHGKMPQAEQKKKGFFKRALEKAQEKAGAKPVK